MDFITHIRAGVSTFYVVRPKLSSQCGVCWVVACASTLKLVVCGHAPPVKYLKFISQRLLLSPNFNRHTLASQDNQE